MIRLYRNNLFLGNKSSNKMKDITVKCYACNEHPESRVELLLNCSTTNKIVQFLIRILRKVGGLINRCEIEMFLFKDYKINSIENISLMFTWKYVYNCKYNKKLSTREIICTLS